MADLKFVKPTYKKGAAEFSVPYYVQTQGGASSGAQAAGSQRVTSGAMLSCSMGTSPGVLTTIPPNRAANVFDALPIANIGPCGMCTSPANPQVAAATGAAMGNLIPVPCVPLTNQWIGGSATEMIQGSPALLPTSTLMCAWAGAITIIWPGPPQT